MSAGPHSCCLPPRMDLAQRRTPGPRLSHSRGPGYMLGARLRASHLFTGVANGCPAIEVVVVLQPEDRPGQLEADWHVRTVKQLARDMEGHEAEHSIEQRLVLDGPEFLGNLDPGKVS